MRVICLILARYGSKRIRNSRGYVGYIIGANKYLGSKQSSEGFKMMIDHVFKEYELKTINGINVKKIF